MLTNLRSEGGSQRGRMVLHQFKEEVWILIGTHNVITNIRSDGGGGGEYKLYEFYECLSRVEAI